MTSTSKAAVTINDPELPALPVLLSECALSEHVGEPLRIRRVRYKPGTSLIVGWERATATGELTDHGWSGVYSDPIKVDHALRAARRHGGHAERLNLPGHAVFADLAADRPLARDLSRLRSQIDDPQVLRHNPLRRVVLRGRLAGRDSSIRFTDRRIDTAVSIVAGLSSRGAPVVPLDSIPRTRRAASSPWWGDHDLTGTGDPEVIAEAGRALAALHVVTTRPDQHAPCPGLDDLGGAVLDLLPTLEPRLGRLRRQLAERWRPPAILHRLHGDFSADQVLVGSGVRLIDLDRTHLGPAERDLGSFIAVEAGTGQGSRSAALAAGYTEAGAELDAETVTWWEVYERLARLAEPFRSFEAGWSGRITALLTETEEVAARWTPSLK